LGNGSSVAAIRGGKCIDTSMGFTPTSGLVMGTRSGDLDPGVLTHLLGGEYMNVSQAQEMVTQHSGLLALTGSSDFREITSRAKGGDERALLGLEVWAWRIRHYIGAYAALLGGVDALVFTGGIGENSGEGRLLATRGLEFLGISVDPYLNSRRSVEPRAISPSQSETSVFVIPTREEFEIASQTAALLGTSR
jgi:acetate kinase